MSVRECDVANEHVVEKVENLYCITRLNVLRHTQGVWFHTVPVEVVGNAAAYDRVIHDKGAFSPGTVGEVERPWYMHPHQADNLLVLHGLRYVELYTAEHGKVESFVVGPNRLEKGGRTVSEGGCILSWPTHVFHRIISDSELGSASLNFALHYEGFDVESNFSIYDLDTETGRYHVIRKGSLDQPIAEGVHSPIAW
jgi:hypothetical protein